MQIHIAIESLVGASAMVLHTTPSGAQTVSTTGTSFKASYERKTRTSTDDTAIRPFQVKIPE